MCKVAKYHVIPTSGSSLHSPLKIRQESVVFQPKKGEPLQEQALLGPQSHSGGELLGPASSNEIDKKSEVPAGHAPVPDKTASALFRPSTWTAFCLLQSLDAHMLSSRTSRGEIPVPLLGWFLQAFAPLHSSYGWQLIAL